MTDDIQIWITASPDAAVRKEGYWSLHGNEWMRKIRPSDMVNFLPGGFSGAVEQAKPLVKKRLIDAMASGYLPGEDGFFVAVTAEILSAALGGDDA